MASFPSQSQPLTSPISPSPAPPLASSHDLLEPTFSQLRALASDLGFLDPAVYPSPGGESLSLLFRHPALAHRFPLVMRLSWAHPSDEVWISLADPSPLTRARDRLLAYLG